MTPWERYQADLKREGLSEDPAQRIAVEHTQALYEALLADYGHEDGLITIIKKTLKRKPKSLLKGLYLWGGVGRGKTWIVDTFYDCLPFPGKNAFIFTASCR